MLYPSEMTVLFFVYYCTTCNLPDLTLLNYLNIDRLIAENNIARYQQGNPIDILYLTTLSYEVVPQLVNFMQNTSERELAEKLEKGLTSKKQALEKEIPWQSFNLSRDRARKILFTIK